MLGLILRKEREGTGGGTLLHVAFLSSPSFNVSLDGISPSAVKEIEAGAEVSFDRTWQSQRCTIVA